MNRLVQYSIAGAVLASLASKVGASTPVVLMVGLIGPPLLHLIWLAVRTE